VLLRLGFKKRRCGYSPTATIRETTGIERTP
jgi:hypothetical protein